MPVSFTTIEEALVRRDSTMMAAAVNLQGVTAMYVNQATGDPAVSVQWMFQYNPDWYVLEMSAEGSLTERWNMSQHRNQVRVGQRVYFLKSKGGRTDRLRTITATGRITKPAYTQSEPGDERPRHFVEVVYDYLVVPNLTEVEMKNDDILRTTTF